MTDASERPDAPIVVLGAGFHGDGRVSAALLRRARHAARLYRMEGAPLIVVSGGRNPPTAPRSEAAAMASVITEEGVPPAVLIREDAARNTDENAQLTAVLLAEDGYREVRVVTDVEHMPRARLAFRQYGMQVVDRPAPKNRAAPTRRLREWAALVYYIGKYCIRALTQRVGA